MTPEEEKQIVEQMAELGTTLFKFTSNGFKCVAINMYNHILTMNMAPVMINLRESIGRAANHAGGYEPGNIAPPRQPRRQQHVV